MEPVECPQLSAIKWNTQVITREKLIEISFSLSPSFNVCNSIQIFLKLIQFESTRRCLLLVISFH